jgi:hypothetical protein
MASSSSEVWSKSVLVWAKLTNVGLSLKFSPQVEQRCCRWSGRSDDEEDSDLLPMQCRWSGDHD